MQGILRKMRVEYDPTKDENVQYYLQLEKEVNLNQFLGKRVIIEYLERINCIICGRETKKSFGQGFCFPCFRDALESAECILRPELCDAHLGKGRDVKWEDDYHNKEHVVYLSHTAGVKVGVTRAIQMQTRWIDQGASKAIVLAEVPYRRLAGEIEVMLKEFISDRTDWRNMLKGNLKEADLLEEKEDLIERLPDEYQDFVSQNDDILQINYPVNCSLEKINSVNLDKQIIIDEVLCGIKGQYLLFTNGSVINIRKYSGYNIKFKA